MRAFFIVIADPVRDRGSGGPVTDTPCHDGIAGTHASSTDLTDSATVISPFKNLAQRAVTAPSAKVGASLRMGAGFHAVVREGWVAAPENLWRGRSISVSLR